MLRVPAFWIEKEVFWPDRQEQAGRKQAVILMNCTGRGLGDYLLSNVQFRQKFNLDRLETAPILIREHQGIPIVATDTFHAILNQADLLITNNTGDRHGNLALNQILTHLNDRCAVITCVATNFGAFSPIAHGYGGLIGVHAMLDAGAQRNDVWKALKNGSFDSYFNIRWRLEMGRMADRDSFHDVGFANFILEHHRTTKLFMAQAHPAGSMVAYIGCRILELLGLPHDSIDKVLAYDCLQFSVRGQPETQFEFKHYGFKYPMRFTDGFDEFYGHLLDLAVESWRLGGFMPPAYDG